jgi:integrase/recombinase XerD
MNNQYLKEYKEYLTLERNYSNNTVISYLTDIIEFSLFYKKDLLNVTDNDILKYLKTMDKLKADSISHKLSSLKSFYNFYLKKGLIKENPIINISRPKLEKKLPTFLTLEEVSSLLNIEVKTPYDARNKAILELLYSSGLRISELTNMELANIDIDACLVRIMGKGSKERIVPLGDYAIKAINEYLCLYRPLLNKKNSAYLFLNNRGNKISRQFIFKVIKQEALKKGIKKNISPHTLRHTFATHLLKNGADLRIIQELLGHENIGTTQIYTHLTNDKLKEDYDSFYPRS